VKEYGQGVNNTRMKGKKAKNEEGENMRSYKKCNCNREEDRTRRDRNVRSSHVNEAERSSDFTEETGNAVVWIYSTVLSC
jgi:hypothetical protein